MKFENNKTRIPIKFWTNDIERGALLQAENLANFEHAFHHIAIMPDVHEGFGIPIGGVMSTRDVIIPNAVGVDIGCGMSAVQTDFLVDSINTERIKKILDKVIRYIPTGFNHHKKAQNWEGFLDFPKVSIIEKEVESAKKQLGTLGGGNHFIELQRGDDGFLWLMLHSGSRNFGYKIADEYNKIARSYCESCSIALIDKNLAFLPLYTVSGQEYFNAMNYALKFAEANRAHMMEIFKCIVSDILQCSFLHEINIHHNYAALEKHFGEEVVVHRKGAIQAYKGQYGIIPGSMGTNSYITKGLGNKEAFCSSSHGAGRKMGRKEAIKRLDLKECQKSMNGIVFDGFKKMKNSEYAVDEAPQAYKDINVVMKNQSDLVEIAVTLYPLGVVKG